MIAFADMMKKQIVMPAHLMDDGEHNSRTGARARSPPPFNCSVRPFELSRRVRSNTHTGRDLFEDYSAIAERTGVYTPFDYVEIMEHLITRWRVADFKLSGDAAEAQDFLMKQPDRIRKLANFAKKKKAAKATTKEQFSWIFNRAVDV